MFHTNFATIVRVKISATIIAFNEEKNIAGAIESLDWADEVIVVDSESTDATRQIAESLGVKVIVNEWPGFSAQKQFAAEAAANDWIFSLDADERVSAALKAEILELAKNGTAYDGFRIPRLTTYMGREIRHGGWYPDRQLRLYRRTKGRWKDVKIHESVEMLPGTAVGLLGGEILHLTVEGPMQHHRMIGERYAPLAAAQMYAEGKRTSALRLAAAGPSAFVRSYFLKGGVLDGLPGFTIAAFAAHHAFLKHLLLLERQREKTSD